MGNTTKTIAALVMASLCGAVIAQDGQRLSGATVIDKSGYTNLPNFIKLNKEQQITQESFVDWATYSFNLPSNSTLKPYETFSDEFGYTHTRYRQYTNGYPVEATQVISHVKEGKIVMVNGDYYQSFNANQAPTLTEQGALQIALNKVHAQKYMWENTAFQLANGYDFSPKGQLVFVHKKDADYSASNMRLAYKFNIYAEQPLYRANLFVDANTGEILDEQNQICTVNAVGTAVTRYSGTVNPFTSDNYGTNQYRLRETGRGNGIQTYNLNNTTTYTNTDFTNNSSTWNLAGNDQAAADAHWGAEMTYDYYKNVHNRNSIDNAGFLLKSYMHYSTNYVNAFWNGQYMTYGDGDGTQFNIMTALDVCGHEITHGLVSFTANLSSGGEPGALNEAWADIMGTSMEAYARPSQHDWLMGADISVTPGGQVRDLSNEHNSGEGAGPNCYNEASYWDAVNQEVHINSGPAGHWYYLLCVGGSGTSGCGNVYNVAGITMTKAEKIAFRGLTVYFTSSTNYTNARNYTIQAATDIYGACSQELASTTNAWFAVNVGAAYTGGVPAAAFTATGSTQSCTAPLAVTFTNTSSGSSSYNWSFGDGGTSTAVSPAHTYTAPGVYNVQLVATGTCSANSKDTMLINNLIVVNGPPTATSPSVPACGPQSYTLTATGPATLTWYDASGQVGTGPTYVTPTLTTTTTYSVTSSIMVAGTSTLSGAPTTTTTLGAGGYLAISNNHYEIFNVLSPFTLKSVDIFAQAGGSTTSISLEDAAGTVLYTLSPTTVTGKNTIALNWHIPVGTGYKIKAGGTSTLYRNNAGATYPIAVGTVASITANDVMGTAPNYYYWFYNWIYAADVPCPSSATVVTATIQNCTGIASYGSENISVYPNPAHNNIFVSAPQNIKSVTVVDMIGQTILSHQPQNETNVSLDVSSLPAGVYFVRVVVGESSKLIKVVKQ